MCLQRTKVPQGLDLFRDPEAFVVIDAWLLWLLILGIVLFPFPQVALERYQNKLHAWAVFCYLANPLRFYVLKRVR
jgi:hypothetical protein